MYVKIMVTMEKENPIIINYCTVKVDIWPISPRCVRIYIVKITSTFSNLVPVLLD